MDRKCINTTCEWHHEGACRLFPGDWGFMECLHSKDTTEKPRPVRKTKTTKKGTK